MGGGGRERANALLPSGCQSSVTPAQTGGTVARDSVLSFGSLWADIEPNSGRQEMGQMLLSCPQYIPPCSSSIQTLQELLLLSAVFGDPGIQCSLSAMPPPLPAPTFPIILCPSRVKPSGISWDFLRDELSPGRPWQGASRQRLSPVWLARG